MVLSLFPCDDIWRNTSVDDENVKLPSTRNPIFTEGWKAYLYNADRRMKRSREPVKQMLEYRGGWKNSKTNVKLLLDPDVSSSSESCVSSFQDIDEVFSHMLVNDSSMPQQLIGDICAQTKQEHGQSKSRCRKKHQNKVRERLCRFCYDQYVSICGEMGYEAVDIHSYGVWRGHSTRNSTGKVTVGNVCLGNDTRNRCPQLWFTRCRHCGAVGDCAHPSYDCPFN